MQLQTISRTSTFAWSYDVLPLLATASVAGAVDLDFSASATLELWDVFASGDAPVFAAKLENKFHALAWLKPLDGYPRGLLVGALETGVLEFWNVDLMLSSQLLDNALVHRLTKHTGAVKLMAFNPHQPYVLATGGQQGEIYIWDVRTFAEPFVPGRAMTPMDEVTSLAWNNAVGHILASTSNGGYTSIWDLKAKREVLHLAYNGASGRADFLSVAWHPTQLTKLATASQSDACAAVMTWDLRNASEPERIMLGHTKGVLSIDWCTRDPLLLLLAGKDNTTKLWNPVEGIKLGEYPVAANWAFLARFAPSAPDVIASALFDGKIVVQTLQDTLPPAAEKVKDTDDLDFWSSIAVTEMNQAVFDVQQAPAWTKRPCSAAFGFGLKLVAVHTSGGRSTVRISHVAADRAGGFSETLAHAVASNDHAAVLASKTGEIPDAADWAVLRQLAEKGKDHFFQTLVDGAGTSVSADATATKAELSLDARLDSNAFLDELDDNFFNQLADAPAGLGVSLPPYVPSGLFGIFGDNASSVDARLARLILSNKIEEAVTVCLEQGKVQHAFALAMDQSAAVKARVRNHFFRQAGDDVLLRLIYAATAGDVLDIVANADISGWKEIAVSILSFCAVGPDFDAKFVELGDRLLSQNPQDSEARTNALLCYLVGSALDKVAAMWLQDLPGLQQRLLDTPDNNIVSAYDARYAALSLFAEKLFVYRGLAEFRDPLSGPAIDPVCKAVLEFASMSASAGHFELASQYLALLPDEFADLKPERERIATALNRAPAGATRLAGVASTLAHASHSAPKRAQNRAQSQRSRYAAPFEASAAQTQPLAPPAPPNAQPNGFNGPGYGNVNGNANAKVANYNAYAPTTLHAAPAAPAAPSAPSGPPAVAAAPARPGATPFNPYGDVAAHARPRRSASTAPIGLIRPPAVPALIEAPTPPRAASVAPTPLLSVKVETDGWNDLPETFKPLRPARRAASSAAPAAVPALPALAPAVTPPVKKSQASPAMPPPRRQVSRTPSQAQIQPQTLPRASLIPPSKYVPPTPTLEATPSNGALAAVNHQPAGSHLAAPPRNPYAPAAPTQSTPKTLYAPPPSHNFAAPPPASPSSTSVANPYAPAASVGTPPLGVLPPPGVSRKASSIVPPPQYGHRRGSSASQTAPSRGPQVAPPVRQPSAFASPVALVSSVSRPPVLAPPASRPPVLAPPMRRPQMEAQPEAAQPEAAPPVTAPPAAAPTALAPPPTFAPPRSAAPSAPPSRKVSVAAFSGDRSQIPPNGQPVYSTFTKLIGEIKPAAPAKYAKHVADMEKRLNILFDVLNKQTLSQGAVEALNKVAGALTEKNYAEAAALNGDIPAHYATEIGDWHTGVKRLVTMAEAFEV